MPGAQKTDVLIIGGGLAGLLCAHRLTAEGVDCTLIEADRIMQGVSRNTTAKITSQHGLVYQKLVDKFDSETAYLYWQANQQALELLKTLAGEADCDYETKDHYMYAPSDLKPLAQEMMALTKAGIPAKWEDSVPLPFSTAGAIRFADQGQFDPLKFASHFCKNLKIWENTRALAFEGNHVQTNRGTITAEKIIVATHFPMNNKHGAYFLKMYQQRSYVLALENAQNVKGMYLSSEKNGLSFRNAGDVLLLGGGGHRTGKRGEGWNGLEKAAQKYYPESKEICRWATQDCMSLDGIPYIGQYSKKTPQFYVTTGFNKWGMTTSMVSAMILSDLVQDKENIYASIFSPSRSVLHRQLFVNSGEAVMNLLTPTVPRCPHMGCALKWNKEEHSWDCPCHGSRFQKDGRLLDNPATGDLDA